jgi:hypothetical protein
MQQTFYPLTSPWQIARLRGNVNLAHRPRNRPIVCTLHNTEAVGKTRGRGHMRGSDETTRDVNWRRTSIKASILLLLLIGKIFGITQAIILLALYSIVVIPL